MHMIDTLICIVYIFVGAKWVLKKVEIECIKVYEGKYFVKMKFYGEGYFTLKGNHVDIVSVGHVINMKNGQLLYTPQNDDTEYISMTQKDY